MDTGFLDEFDVKKYVKDRLLEIKDEEEYALAKRVLYDGLYKMSHVFEERFQSLYHRVFDELESLDESCEIAMLLLSKKDFVFLRMFFPMVEEDLPQSKAEDQESKVSQKQAESIKTIYLDAEDTLCKAFVKEKLPVRLIKDGVEETYFIQPKKALRYRQEVGKLHETFSHNGFRWNTINTAYLDRFFDIDLSGVPENARVLEVDYGSYAEMVREELYPVWNVSKTMFKSSTFLSPSKDGLYYEHEMMMPKDREIVLRLVCKTDGMVEVRQEEGKIIVKSYEESYGDLEGYHVFDIRYTKEELPPGLISNQRKESILGRLKGKYPVNIHTQGEIYRIVEELNIGTYVSLRSCERVSAKKDFIEKEKAILPDMNCFYREEAVLLAEGPTLVLRFIRNSSSNLCEVMVRYAVSQVQLYFEEYNCVGVLESSYAV